jgi:hypothetical protein
MRKVIVVALVLIIALVAVLPALAHSAPPCNDSGEPGNSDYAQHHIVPLAHEGGLGEGGHKPGSHHGFSTCNPGNNP